MPPRRRRQPAWTQHPYIENNILVEAVLREASREGVAVEVVESLTEWREALASPSIFGGWRPGPSPVRWRRATRGQMLAGVTFGAMVYQSGSARSQIIVLSPYLLDKYALKSEYLQQMHSGERWARTVAHELCHIYWSREVGRQGGNVDVLREFRRLTYWYRQSEVRIEAAERFGEIVVRGAYDHAKGYVGQVNQGEEFFVELAVEGWADEASEAESVAEVPSVRKYWERVSSFVRGLR